MRWDATHLARAWASVKAATPKPDWCLLTLIAGFLLVVPLRELTGASLSSPLSWIYRLFAPDPFTDYQNAIVAAAIKRPMYREDLAVLDASTDQAGTVEVASFGDGRELPSENRNFPIWVAPRKGLRDACAGASDPLRKLQELLGLPPAAGTFFVREIEVPKEGLFRPCVGSEDAGPPPTCTFDLPPEPAGSADADTLRAAYDRLRFVTQQMWQSYRADFHRDTRSDADYPFTGHPFTGMGWAYDWGASSRDHVGVSEFVIKNDAVIKVVGKKTPAEFCAKAK